MRTAILILALVSLNACRSVPEAPPEGRVTLAVTSVTHAWIEYEIHNGTDSAIKFDTVLQRPRVTQERLQDGAWVAVSSIGCGNGWAYEILKPGQSFVSRLGVRERVKPTRLKLWICKPGSFDGYLQNGVAPGEAWPVASDPIPAFFKTP